MGLDCPRVSDGRPRPAAVSPVILKTGPGVSFRCGDKNFLSKNFSKSKKVHVNFLSTQGLRGRFPVSPVSIMTGNMTGTRFGVGHFSCTLGGRTTGMGYPSPSDRPRSSLSEKNLSHPSKVLTYLGNPHAMPLPRSLPDVWEVALAYILTLYSY